MNDPRLKISTYLVQIRTKKWLGNELVFEITLSPSFQMYAVDLYDEVFCKYLRSIGKKKWDDPTPFGDRHYFDMCEVD